MTNSVLPRLTLAFVLASFSVAAKAQEEAPAAAPAAAATPEAPAPSEATTETPAAETAPADEGAAEPAATTGSVSISSTPAGTIYIDDENTGRTTPVVDLPVEPGTHTLRVVDESTGAEKKVTFHVEPGATLNLNVNLAEAAAAPAVADAESQPADAQTADATSADAAPADDAAPVVTEPKQSWTWMTVTGWAGLGLGTIGLVSGAVVLSTEGDPDRDTLGFGLFGAGAGLLLGGGVLLYLDNELADTQAATTTEPEATSWIPLAPTVAAR